MRRSRRSGTSLSGPRGTPDEAIRELQRVIKAEPQFAQAHQFLGLAFAAKHDVAQARRELTEAVKFALNVDHVRTALAAIRLNRRNVSAATILGDAYLRKGELSKSKQAFRHYRLGLIARAEKKMSDRRDPACAGEPEKGPRARDAPIAGVS